MLTCPRPSAGPYATSAVLFVVCAIWILQAENATPGDTTVLDDVTGTSIASCQTTPATCSGSPFRLTTAVYSLGGNQVGSSGGLSDYTLLATNPANNPVYGSNSTVVPTWGVGTSSTGFSTLQCYTPGAIFSNTASAQTRSLYVCTFQQNGSLQWTSIP